MPFQTIDLPDTAAATAGQSVATKAGGVVYVSGIGAAGKDGIVRSPGNVRLQTRQVLDAMTQVLEAAGATMADVAMTQVVLRYRGDLAAFEEAYAAAFPDAKPARQLAIGETVAPEGLVEIACIAHVDG